MIPFQERKKLRAILYSKVTLGILFVVLALVLKGAWSVHQKAEIARSEYEEAQRGLGELTARKDELQASLGRLKSEQGIEEELRMKFTVARPGEELVVIVDESSQKGENGGASEGETFWERVKRIFSGN